MPSFLVSSGCHNRIPETEWLEQQTFSSHISRGRKSEIKVPAWLGSWRGSPSQFLSLHSRRWGDTDGERSVWRERERERISHVS